MALLLDAANEFDITVKCHSLACTEVSYPDAAHHVEACRISSLLLSACSIDDILHLVSLR